MRITLCIILILFLVILTQLPALNKYWDSKGEETSSTVPSQELGQQPQPPRANTFPVPAQKTSRTGIQPEALKAGTEGIDLITAVKEGYTDIALEMIRNGAEVNTKDRSDWAPLHHAALNGRTEIASALIKAGAEVDDAANQSGWTPLVMAAMKGEAETVKVLLQGGAEVNKEAKRRGVVWSETALDVAAKNGHAAAVQVLISAGAHVENTTRRVMSPLLRAVSGGHTEAVLALLEGGADPTKRKDRYSNAPITIAATHGYTAIVEALLQAGASADVKNMGGETPLMIASAMGHDSVVEVLKNAGAREGDDLDYKAKKMYFAASRGRAETVKALIEEGVDPNTKHIFGGSALGGAARAPGDGSLVKMLIDTGADVNAGINEERMTPLMGAASSGRIENLRVLIEAGADLNATFRNETALDYAQKRQKNTPAVKILEEAGALDGTAVWAARKAKKMGPLEPGVTILLSGTFEVRGDTEYASYMRVTDSSGVKTLIAVPLQRLMGVGSRVEVLGGKSYRDVVRPYDKMPVPVDLYSVTRFRIDGKEMRGFEKPDLPKDYRQLPNASPAKVLPEATEFEKLP